MRILLIFISVIFFVSCVSPLNKGICPFYEHSSQIFWLGNGFFAFNVKEYNKGYEKLHIRYFGSNGKQLCSNEIDYPFSFYNFLVREKDKDSVFIVSQDRTKGRENLVLEVSNDCQKRGEFRINADNYETISDIKVLRQDVYICGWAESKYRDILPIGLNAQGTKSNIIVEHDSLIAIYDSFFNEKKKIIKGDYDAEYVFSIAITSDNKVLYAGSVMSFGIDSSRNKVLNSVNLFIMEADVNSDEFFLRDNVYPVDYNLMPFFVSEYNKYYILLVTMGKMEGKNTLGVSVGDKSKRDFQTALYLLEGDYLPFYPLLIKDDKVFLRFLEIKNNVLDKFYIIDLKNSEAISVWIKGANNIAFGINDDVFNLCYSVIVKPCNESLFLSKSLFINDISSNKVIKSDMIENIIIDKVKPFKYLTNFKNE